MEPQQRPLAHVVARHPADELWAVEQQPVAAADRRLPHLGSHDDDARKWTRPFSFLQMADTQLGFVETCQASGMAVRAVPEAETPPEGFAAEFALLNRAVDEINRLRPAFAVVCGDLVNAMPEAMGKGDSEKRAVQLSAFKEACARVHSSVPLVCVCGNHDVGDRPNAASIEQYRGEFGDDYFSFWVRGVKCICVNSQFWKDSSDAADLRTAHDSWLQRELQDPDTIAAKYVLVFAHIPPFIFAQNEPAEYFNLAPDIRDEVMQLFARAGVRAVFCGHYHRNAGGWWRPSHSAEGANVEAAEDKPVEVVVTGATVRPHEKRPLHKNDCTKKQFAD
eukprot:COSAG02_NODE_5261_length_4489_cov_10.826879_1_plen_335_part_00